MVDTVRAMPTEKRPTHDIELIDSEGVGLGLILCDSTGKPIQEGKPWTLRQTGSSRTALQINSGDADYSDYQLPYTPFTQKDWSGGRGNEDFEKDKTRYFDGNCLDTHGGDIILSGKSTTVPLTQSQEYIEPIAYVSNDIINEATNNLRFATKYSPPTESFGVTAITLRVAPGTCTVQIMADSAGSPSGTVIASGIATAIALQTSTALFGACLGSFPIGKQEIAHGLNTINPLETVLITIPLSILLFFGTTYWIVVTSTVVGYDDLVGGIIKKEVTTNNWSTDHSDFNLYFKLSTTGNGLITLFRYLGALYAITKPDNGTASKLYFNGYRFVAQTGSNQTKLVTGLSMELNELAGCVAVCVGGLGYLDNPNYRTIASNTVAGDIILENGLTTVPDNTSEYVIIGCNVWKEITTTGLTGAVTSVAVVNDIVYFAQGESIAIRRMREYNNAGTWTREFADESTTKATLLKLFTAISGKQQFWKFNNPTIGNPTATYATPVAWGVSTYLDFTTKPSELAGATVYPIPIGYSGSKITGVEGYGDPVIPWVIKEDEFGSISDGIYGKVPINELAQVKSLNNGLTVIQYGVYLFFSVLDGLERYYDNRLDDIGPNADQGLPIGRQGNISCVVAYPGGLFMGVDAGATGYSSVLFYNGTGYHEVYRASVGQRIRSLFIQVVPGNAVGRLWIGFSGSTVWVPVSLNPRVQPTYQYSSTGWVESSWINGGFGEINKFWKSIQVFAENLSSGQTVSMEYATDADVVNGIVATWHAFPDIYDTSPMQEVLISSNYSVWGKRFKYRITLSTDDPLKSPRVKAVTIPAITRLPPNKSWTMTFILDDALVDRQGTRQVLSAEDAMLQIEHWANSETTPVPITLHSPVKMFDDRRVFIEPASLQPMEVINDPITSKKVKAICSLSVFEA